ncbi:MAG TPA: DUF3307 domain-containing protein [Bryobacteraceae bacterium]|nr:DUF3307 domain-containing protein [Bryobacteraceae bacterium]
MAFARLLLLLLAGHALCDYPLQGDFLARGKNHKAPLPGIPWWQCLAAHSMIHAGAVMLITGSLWLALTELVIHTATDYAKCDSRITFNQDQAVHVTCKLLWSVLWVLGCK